MNVFLLRKAVAILPPATEMHYSYTEMKNYILVDNQKLPAYEDPRFSITHSKTEAAPGDDDPDPLNESCL